MTWRQLVWWATSVSHNQFQVMRFKNSITELVSETDRRDA